MIADIFDFAPALALADERTTTDVIGSPPNKELIRFPVPCAFNSRLVLVNRFCGSIRSEASIHKSVSIEAIMAIVNATVQTSLLAKLEKLIPREKFKKSGRIKIPLNSSK